MGKCIEVNGWLFKTSDTTVEFGWYNSWIWMEFIPIVICQWNIFSFTVWYMGKVKCHTVPNVSKWPHLDFRLDNTVLKPKQCWTAWYYNHLTWHKYWSYIGILIPIWFGLGSHVSKLIFTLKTFLLGGDWILDFLQCSSSICSDTIRSILILTTPQVLAFFWYQDYYKGPCDCGDILYSFWACHFEQKTWKIGLGLKRLGDTVSILSAIFAAPKRHATSQLRNSGIIATIKTSYRY